MAERFERLFSLPEKQYVTGSPVVVAAGALLKDNSSGHIIVQLKLQSVSKKRIKAVKLSLAAYDISGKELRGVSDYQYLELNVIDGQEFGSNKAIVMPDSVTRSFKVTSLVVVFADGSIWQSTIPFTPLPSPQQLQKYLGEPELEKQYCIETTAKSQWVPQEANGLWQCACGCWNGGNQCTNCTSKKETLFMSLELSFLTERMNIRLERERIQHETEFAQQARLKAEAEEKRKITQKRTKIATLSIILVAGLIAFSALCKNTIYPAIKYNEAVKKLEAGSFSDAVDTFEELGDYKDSLEKKVVGELGIAYTAYENGDYNRAIELYALIDTPEAANMISKCNYQIAKTAFEQKDYSTALEYFSSVNTDEAKEQIKACNYELMLTAIAAENWNTALRCLDNARGYKDADSFYDIIRYREADYLIEHGHYENAYDILKGYIDKDEYKEFVPLINECLYYLGISEYEMGRYANEYYILAVGRFRRLLDDEIFGADATEHYYLCAKAIHEYDKVLAGKYFESISGYKDSSVYAQTTSLKSNDLTKNSSSSITLDELQGTWVYEYGDGYYKKLFINGASATYHTWNGQHFEYLGLSGTIQITEFGFSISGKSFWHFQDGTEKVVDESDTNSFHIIDLQKTSFTEDSGWIFQKK